MRTRVIMMVLLQSAAPAARAEEPTAAARLDLPGVFRLARVVDTSATGRRGVERGLLLVTAQEGFDPADPDASGRVDTLTLIVEREGAPAVAASLRAPGHVSAVDAADVDGDRVPEILVATERGIVPCRVGAPPAEACGAPLVDEAYLHDDRSALDLPLAVDVDGDGNADVVIPTAAGEDRYPWREGVPFAARIRSSLPLPAFVLGSEAPTVVAQLAERSGPPSLALVTPLPRYLDLDGDGRMDAVLPLRQRLGALEGLRVFFGEGEGESGSARDILLSLGGNELVGSQDEMAFGDLDGDGRLEVGILSYDLERLGITQTRRLRVLGFAEGYVPRAEPLLDVETSSNVWEPSLLSLGDADGDGAGDVLVVHVGGLRKAAVTVEWHRRGADGRFRHASQTLKLPKDDDIDRAALTPPVDLDGDGKVDLVIRGERIVHLFAGQLSGGDVVVTTPAATLRPEGIDKILAVLPDGPSRRLWVVARRKDGRCEVLLRQGAPGRSE